MKALQQIEHIKQRIVALGPLLPGSISEQWNTCGKKECACKDPKNPVRHGPYFQLSFSVKGRSSTMFLKQDDLAEAKRRIRRYQEFKDLCFELVDACVALAKEEKATTGGIDA